MATLASYTGRTTSLEAAVTIPADGPVHFILYGQLGTKAIVKVRIKTADTAFTELPETTFYQRTGVILNLKAGDQVQVEFIECLNAKAEIKQ